MMPGQESIDFAVRPACGDALKCLGEPSGWIDVVHLRGLQECGDRRPCLPAAIGSGEQSILAGDRLRADRALDGVAVDIEAAVTQEALETLAPDLGIADRFGKSRLAGDTGQFLFPEWPEVGDDRGGSFLTRGAAKIGIRPRILSSIFHNLAIR